jgi:hypothetical protein
MSRWDETKRQITESQIWQSIFRHGYDDTRRQPYMKPATLAHLHPAKVVPRRAHFTCAWAASLPCFGDGGDRCL